jgi:hypothetical protein
VPKNIVLLPLPPYAPALNWNGLMAKSNVITSIGTGEWAQVRI